MPIDPLEKPVSYYELLEVQPDASDEEIKRAYRSLALKYHPDRWRFSPERKAAEARFRLINEAYAYLKTPERRAAYLVAQNTARNDNNKTFWSHIAGIFRADAAK